MKTSQNGWPVITSGGSPLLVPFRWVTGRVLTGDAYKILDYLCTQFNDRVEPIEKSSSWGYANRNVRLGLSVSNHASGTAVDLNAPRHALGRAGTFTPAQRGQIEAILAELHGSVRWGGHYRLRKDEMHFEIVAAPTRLRGIVGQLEAGGITGAWGPAEVRALQSWLNRKRRPIRSWPLLAIDGDLGKLTVTSLQMLIGASPDGDFGPASARALEKYLTIPAGTIPGWYPSLRRALQLRIQKETT